MNVGFTANIQQYYSNAEHPPIMSKQGGMYWLRLYTVLRQGGGASEKSVIILNWWLTINEWNIIPEYTNRFCKILAFNANF